MKNKGNKRNINNRLAILIALVIVVILVLIFTIVKLTRKDSATKEKSSNSTENYGEYADVLYNYFKDMDFQQVQDINTIEGTNATWLFTGYKKDTFPDYIEYKNEIYKIIYTDTNMYDIKKVVKVNSNADLNKKGIYDIDGLKVLVTPEYEFDKIHLPIDLSEYIGTVYYLKENGTDIDINRKVTENIYSVDEKVYNSSNEVINIINAEGPMNFTAYYYLKDNDEPDFSRPFEKGYYSNLTNSYYDISGKLVDVILIDGGE